MIPSIPDDSVLVNDSFDNCMVRVEAPPPPWPSNCVIGEYVTMKGFGASAPAATLFKEFGFTVENVVNTVKNIL